MNAVEIETAISELACQPFDAVEFPFAFLAAFGNQDMALRHSSRTLHCESLIWKSNELVTMWVRRQPVRYLLDTCVLSELVKKHSDPRVVTWVDARESVGFLSVLTLRELQKGLARSMTD